MKLSEFYINEKFSYIVDGIRFSRDFLTTENGELYVDEERNLYYREASSSSSALLRSEVGEWIYFNDNKIICTASDLDNSFDAIYVCIVDIQGNLLTSGTLTQFGLVYSRDNQIIKEDPVQNETVIFELNSSETPVMYWDNSFSIPFYYPHSDFLYNKFYDYDGNYLKDKTEKTFVEMFLRDIIYAFVHCPIDFSGLTLQQRETFEEFDKIRFGSSKVTYEVVERIISLAEEMNISDRHAVKGYQKIKRVFLSHDVTDNLVKPLLNIMVVNRSGEFGRRSSKWTSLVNAKRIETIAKKSKGNFKNIVSDITLLWESMSAISK